MEMIQVKDYSLEPSVSGLAQAGPKITKGLQMTYICVYCPHKPGNVE